MKIYDFAPSPNARNVRSVVYELGLAPTFVHVNIFAGEARSPAFLARNPNGRIPVLEDGDFVLWESNAIISYLAALNPAHGLLPAEPRPRAEVDRWLFWQTAHLGPAVGKIAFERIVKGLTGAGEPDPKVVELGLAEFHANSTVLDGALAGRDYVAGRLSVADFAIAAFYSVRERCGLDMRQYRNVAAWLERMEARASVRRALADVQQALAR